MIISAQKYSLTNEAYENKVVEQYEGVEAGALKVNRTKACPTQKHYIID